ncbi:hypothetical protein ACFQVC_24565 [Streptomyces monticola]|uniref:Uncharacterized protein n=1 Tax=Streptomyces monticola TaxID=2666263 RepID=A0ABW2JPY9_9ACTN
MRTLSKASTTGALAAGVAAAVLLSASPAFAAKKHYVADSHHHTRTTAVVADKKANKLHYLMGDYTAPKKGTYFLRSVVVKPGKKPQLGKWLRAKFVGEISNVYRVSWDYKSSPRTFPDKTKVYTQIKGVGNTPAIKL